MTLLAFEPAAIPAVRTARTPTTNHWPLTTDH
jgi:hypothetical protein